METSLKQQAIDVLHANKGRWRIIERDTGLGYQWMAKLSQDKIPNPGVERIEKLIKWASSGGRAA